MRWHLIAWQRLWLLQSQSRNSAARNSRFQLVSKLSRQKSRPRVYVGIGCFYAFFFLLSASGPTTRPTHNNLQRRSAAPHISSFAAPSTFNVHSNMVSLLRYDAYVFSFGGAGDLLNKKGIILLYSVVRTTQAATCFNLQNSRKC